MLILRRTLFAILIASVLSIVLLTAFAAALDAGYFRALVIRFLSAHFSRTIEVNGALHVQVLSWNPELSADDVSIGNPSWFPPGRTARIGHVLLRLETPRFRQPICIARLSVQGAKLELLRNTFGQANWNMTDPLALNGRAADLPWVRSFAMPDAEVELSDERRNLRFHGRVSVEEPPNPALPSLRIIANGQLNDRLVAIEVTGEPLATASHARPYGFVFAERSSGSSITGQGALLHPFALTALDFRFDAAGEDLRDLYFLTGVKLINTAPFRLSSVFERRGSTFTYRDLQLKFGQSDLGGILTIETATGRSAIGAEFSSALIRTADIGLQAAGRAPPGPPLLLSDASFTRKAVLIADAHVNLKARQFQLGRVPLSTLALQAELDHGVLVVTPLTADLLQGKVRARLRIDARPLSPASEVDIQMSGLQLESLHSTASTQPPLAGAMHARITVQGRGSSAHQVAASANGRLTAVISRGEVRAAWAELAGLDLRGLGLTLAKNQKEAVVRCGVASFDANAGRLQSQTLVLDTEPVLIRGEGRIDLESEALNLEFSGHPKHLRLLRLRSPVLLRGTLTHPSLTLKSGAATAQTVAAVGLGVVLTPLAAILAFVDPGLAKDTDCAALLADAAPQ